MAWIKQKLVLPKELTAKQSEAVAKEVIDFIVERTLKGNDVSGNKWKGPAGKYSKNYKKSLEFKNAGKGSKVNLELSGEMLNSLKVLSFKKGQALIGYKNGSEANGKAEGNIKGTYGQKTPIRGKARNFLGLNTKKGAILQKDLIPIVKEVVGSGEKLSAIRALSTSVVDAIAGVDESEG